MGAKSKQKGNRYERRCVQLLTEFTGVSFRRIPSSGAFNKFGGVKVAEHVFSGDAICDKPNFAFSVEAKSRKAFSFVALLKDPDKAEFTKWWKQCVDDAKAVNKLPMLMFKPDTQEDFVAISQKGMELLEIAHRYIPHFAIKIYNCGGGDCHVCDEFGSACNDSANLPTPKIFRWKTLTSAANPEKMFGG